MLLIAEAANPRWVSIPLEGWSHARAITRHVESAGGAAHLVTHVRNRESIVGEGLVEGRDFTAIDSEAVAGPLYRMASLLRGGAGKGWTTVTALSALAYPWFEHLVWRRFGREIIEGRWDIIHRLTPLSPTVPSLLSERCASAGAAFVLGPLNGGVPWPGEFDAARRREREWLSYVRDAYRLMPGYRSTLRHAAAVIAGSLDTLEALPRWVRHKTHYVPENAVEPARFDAARRHRITRPMKCVFVGRLVPYKGADMLIEAAAPLIRAGEVTVDVIGDGPMMADLRALAARLGVEPGVALSGWVKHEQVGERLARADVFAFPSIREFGGAVVLEAMMVGLVPVVVDYGGPGELVSTDTGVLLPLGPREQIVGAMRAALEALAHDPERVEAMSLAARQRVRSLFTWDAKAASVVEIYRQVMESRAAGRSRWHTRHADATIGRNGRNGARGLPTAQAGRMVDVAGG